MTHIFSHYIFLQRVSSGARNKYNQVLEPTITKICQFYHLYRMSLNSLRIFSSMIPGLKLKYRICNVEITIEFRLTSILLFTLFL